ncbi:MAG: sporulation/spore germination protein [Rhizonema sp. NSF051]|nr:sporulation/spore germination protein [Rhizonema sp. NSF051]
MNASQKFINPFLLIAVVASFSSCHSMSTARHLDTKTPAVGTNNSTLSSAPSMADLGAKKSTRVEPLLPKEFLAENKASLTSGEVTTQNAKATLYTSDSQCQELIPQKVSVLAQEPVTDAVGKIIQQQDTADFDLSGYRVSIKKGVATVDLRTAPNSRRQFTSLSSCEQFTLFGSLRKTLVSNTQWNIKKVRFTDRGKEIQ